MIGHEEIADLMTRHYQRVWRLSHALCGDSAASLAIVKAVLKQGLAMADRWQDDAEAEAWFLHHTILESRQIKTEISNWAWLIDAAPEVRAFIKAIDGLPRQQKEVIILTDAERLDLRRAAVAMDCSTTAATNHLAAARTALKKLVGADFERLMQRFVAAYHSPPPAPDISIGAAIKKSARRVWLRRIIKTVLALILLGTAAWTGRKLLKP